VLGVTGDEIIRKQHIAEFSSSDVRAWKVRAYVDAF